MVNSRDSVITINSYPVVDEGIETPDMTPQHAGELRAPRLPDRCSDGLVFYDHLTGLPNRPVLEQRLQQLLAGTDRICRSVALLLVGLDNFKGINDALGHTVGDRLLQHAAENMARCVRQEDTVARLGGDEFAIVLSALPAPRDEAARVAAAIAAKIGLAVAAPFHDGEHEIVLRASIGIAFSLAGMAAHGGDLLRDAAAALHDAKKQGRNIKAIRSANR